MAWDNSRSAFRVSVTGRIEIEAIAALPMFGEYFNLGEHIVTGIVLRAGAANG